MNRPQKVHISRWAGLAMSTPARLTGGFLALAIAAIHVADQGGFPGTKEPTYVGIGYYLLELACLLVAVTLLWPGRRSALPTIWLLAAFVAAAPLLGYTLSRGPGLPAYTEDRGNWTEPLGVISLAVETALLVLSLAAVVLSSAGHTTSKPHSGRAETAVGARG